MPLPRSVVWRGSGFGAVAVGAVLVAGAATGWSWMEGLVALVRPGEPLSAAMEAYYRQGQVVMGLSLVVAGLCVPLLVERLKRRTCHVSRGGLLGTLVAVSLTLTLWAQGRLFENLPHVTDAISHDFQARVVREGRIAAPAPPCPDAFFQHHVLITRDGKWFSKYTPGHPLLLAAGYAMRIPWLPVALCHALTVVALFFLVARHYDEHTARGVALLHAISPMATLLGASFMSHSTFLFLAVSGAALLTRAYDAEASGQSPARRRLWAGLSGFTWGWALITRPHEAVIAAAMVVAALSIAFRGPFRRVWNVGWRCVPGLLPPLLLMLLWNHAQYGVWFAAGYGLTQDPALHRIYQASFGLHDGFTLRDALRLLANTAYRFDRAMLGWPFTILFCLPILLRSRLDRRDAICVVAALLHMAVYFFYDYYGMEYEARYYANLMPLAFVLLVRSALVCARRFPIGVPILFAALTAHSAFHFWPRYVLPTYGNAYEEVSRRPQEAVDRLLQELDRETKLLVLMESSPLHRFVYSNGFLRNDPLLEQRVIYARYQEETAACLRNRFPDRAVYLMAPDTFHLRPPSPEHGPP